MHILAAQAGIVGDSSEAIDPNQSPGRIVFVSAADTDLAALAHANAASNGGLNQLRLAQLSWFSHPYSVDLYLDKTATKAQLVIVRALGGLPYWRYCLEQFSARLAESNVLFAALPGDDRPDDELLSLSSVPESQWIQLLGYCVEGGPENASNFLKLCRHLVGDAPRPLPPIPLLRSGIYWPALPGCSFEQVEQLWQTAEPVVAVIFYRSLLVSSGTEPIDKLVAGLRSENLNPLPLFVASIKDPVSRATIEELFGRAAPNIVINCTSFASGSPDAGHLPGTRRRTSPLEALGSPVLQAVLGACSEEVWLDSQAGLPVRDIAMNIALPEVDGRIITRAIGFKQEAFHDERTQCPVAGFRARPDRVTFVARLAAAWAKLAHKPVRNRRIAIVLANYPNKDGRLANGVGLDTPESTANILMRLRKAGYSLPGAPVTGKELMAILTSGPTNAPGDRKLRKGSVRYPLGEYRVEWNRLDTHVRNGIATRWGPPEEDPHVEDGAFVLSAHRFGNVVVAIQPARGYNIDPKDTYHCPDLPPPHNYAAFYCWLRNCFCADAILHMGKHGNLEWLPGKATGLSASCFPESILGPVPHVYPFIANDPGEGTQAKRRTQAVIIDHLTPPLTRAETYGELRELELLVDEYYDAAGFDPRRVAHLRKDILSLTSAISLDRDLDLAEDEDADSRLRKIDAFLCDIKESQIRNGLHVFGRPPAAELEADLAVALCRVPRGRDRHRDESLIRALARDFDLTGHFDPLSCDFSRPWTGNRPERLAELSEDRWRSHGDTVERLELYALAMLNGQASAPGRVSQAVHAFIVESVLPAIRYSGENEVAGTLRALDGKFVEPGPSGAPTRGRLDVLPTGRNFYSVDSRSLPTRAAWSLGWESASLLVERHLQDNGDWPRSVAVTAWGTSNMRTGGDDIAQALALMGAKPVWDDGSGRVTGFEILPLDVLGRPRVDVTFRVSGFFRDAFPAQLELIDSAARAIMKLDEPADLNPSALAFKKDTPRLGEVQAGHRVFGSKPGAYGAGLQAMIDEQLWKSRSDLGSVYVEWGGYAYGVHAKGTDAREEFANRLSVLDAIVQNQDNREHDLLDSDDYYQFEGGMAAAAEALGGRQPSLYHNDHSRPERPTIRTLEEEISRVVRARVVNPKWIDGVKRHGYKGAFEIAATVDYLFAFASTTGAAKSHHFDLICSAYLEDESTRDFLSSANPAALQEIVDRLEEAIDRELWHPRRNSVHSLLTDLRARF